MFLLLAPATSRLNILTKSRLPWLAISSNFESPLPETSNPLALYMTAMSAKDLVDRDNNVIFSFGSVCFLLLFY